MTDLEHLYHTDDISCSLGSSASNLKQVANYCVLRPTQPTILIGTGNEYAYGLRGLMPIVWLIGAAVYLLAASRVQLFVSAGNGWWRPHNELHYSKYQDLFLYV